jgi:hypothetical protein
METATERNGMSNMFDAPASSGAGVKPVDVENHLLVVEPLEHVASMTTAYGESDAIRVNVHDITDSVTYDNVLWFPKALVSSLKLSIGKRVLGVMGKGTAKPGQSAPWVLIDASGSADAVKAATTYLNGQTAASMTAPQADPAPAAPSALDAALGNLAAAGLTK